MNTSRGRGLKTARYLAACAALVVALTDSGVARAQDLYGCDRSGQLFILDLSTGAGTWLCNLPTFPDPGATEIEFDDFSHRAIVQSRDGILAHQEFDIFNCVAYGPAVGNGLAFNGLEFISGVLYGTAIPFQCQPSELRILHPTTGVSVPVGPTQRGPISGLAYDGPSGVLYGITGCSQTFPTELVTLNLTTGAATHVAYLGFSGAGSLEFGPDGQLYAGGDNNDGGHLYLIDPVVGTATLVGPTGFGSVTGLALALYPLPVEETTWGELKHRYLADE